MQFITESGQHPYLEIVEQPQSKGFRFRYACEGKSHGGIQGHNSRKDKKTYPTVKVRNYCGPVKIVVSLVTDEDCPKPHAHELNGKNCENGTCMVVVNGKEPVASFPNVGIKHITKKNVILVLQERLKESYKLKRSNLFQGINDINSIILSEEEEEIIKKQSEELSKDMKLNVVRLQFQAYLLDEGGTPMAVLPPKYSWPINDSKASCASLLKICRMDKLGGCCTGNEEVFMLCDKVQKEDIAIRFYEQDEYGTIHWEELGIFGPTDVHRQYAIVFRTPAYHNTNITSTTSVHIQLVRKSDGEVSDPKTFDYYPVKTVSEINGVDAKRKRTFEFSDYPMSHVTENRKNNYPRTFGNYSQMDFGDISSINLGNVYNQEVPYATFEDHHNPLIGRGHVKVMPEGQKSQEKPKDKSDDDDEEEKKKTNKSKASLLSKKIEQLSDCLRMYSCTDDARFLISPLKSLIKRPNEDGDNSLHLSIIHDKSMAAYNLLSVLNSTSTKHLTLDGLNNLQQSPVLLSVVINGPSHLRMLLESGCDVTHVTSDGDTLLHVAAKMDHHECLKLLLEHRTDYFTKVIDQYNFRGFTAVHEASKRGNLKCLTPLVHHGANIQLGDQLSGRNALHHAVQEKHICVIAYLILETSIDINATTLNGTTALQMATSSDQSEAVSLLKSADAKFGTSDEEASESDEDSEEDADCSDGDDDLKTRFEKCSITDGTGQSLSQDKESLIKSTVAHISSTLTSNITPDMISETIPVVGCQLTSVMSSSEGQIKSNVFDSGIESLRKDDDVQESLKESQT